MGVAVVYLSYIPYGASFLERFLNSYTSNAAGKDHELIILFNGFTKKEDAIPFLKILEQHEVAARILYSTALFDISAYLEMAKQLDQEYISFLNTHSQLLHPNWLKHLYQNILEENIGCVGATGSWGNKERDDKYCALVRNPSNYFRPVALKEMIKYRFNFYPAVSAHLRTNAFLIKRNLFLKVQYRLFKPLMANIIYGFKECKFTTECFEHGKNCLTNQLNAMGFLVLIVDKNGRAYKIEEWRDSNVFWQGVQENLLISDNQTAKFEEGDLKEKKRLNYLAWGGKN